MPRRPITSGVLILAAWVSVVTLAPPAQAADDYPYAGLGQCPLVPLPPEPPTDEPQGEKGTEGGDGPKDGAKDGANEGANEGKADQQAEPAPVRRVCAKNVWYVDGSMADPWGFALRHCTSFVTWRLRETNGAREFTNYLDGGHFSNAENWDDNARDLGFLVDHVPAVGAVAQTDDGVYGHVAWVSAVHTDGTVTVEEYNHAAPGVYGTRTVPATDFRYIHVRDVAPGATSGSQRALVSAADADGRTWTARTTPTGDLLVRGPSGRERRVGAPSSWTAYAAPALGIDDDGRVRLAAVTTDGRLVTRTTDSRGRWLPTRRIAGAGWSTTASPVLAVVGDRPTLWATTATGDLVERHARGDRPARWSSPSRVGRPGSWAAHAAPAVTTDGDGDVWLAAVTRSGRLLTRHSRPGGGWTRFAAVGPGSGAREWSRVGGPALTADADGRLWLHAVTAGGGLVVRSADDTGRWGPAARLAGSWSPYAAPAVTLDRSGRLWAAAVGSRGTLKLRRTTPEAGAWRAVRTVGRPGVWSATTGPALVASSPGGARLAAAHVTGAVRSRDVGTGERPTTQGPLRAGFGI